MKERVSELEKKAESTPTAYRLSPSKQDLARAAAVPLPEDSPVVAKTSLPPQPPRATLPESPSLSQLLHRNVQNDAPDMPSLLDLSMADMTAHAGSPAPVARRQLSQTLREPTPSPGSVAQLIGRFSKSPQETPDKSLTARPRASSSSLGQDSTPTSISARSSAMLSAEHTPSPQLAKTQSSSTTPDTQGKERRISPLPRRASNIAEAETEDSPNRSLKRKGSDIELSFSESTPVARSKLAPRFSQPLIAFDSPMRRQSVKPFVFGAGHAGFFDDLMEIQSGGPVEGKETAEDINQFLDGLLPTPTTTEDEPARFADAVEDAEAIDLLASPAPPTLPQALEPEQEEERQDDTIVAAGEVNLLGLEPEPETTEEVKQEPDIVDLADDEATQPQPGPEPATAATSTEEVHHPEAEGPNQAAVPAAAPDADVDELERTLAAATIASPSCVDHSAVQPQAALSSSSVLGVEVASPSTDAPAGASTEHRGVVDEEPQPVVSAEREEPEPSVPKLQPALVPVPAASRTPEHTATAQTETADAPSVVDLLKESQSSATVRPEDAQPTASTAPPAAPPAGGRRHMRNVTAPAKPTTSRLGPPSRPARPAPGAEKKSFKPTSRLGVSDSSKAAPAPARLAMATKASQAKAAPAQKPATAPRAVSSSSAASKPPSRGPSRPASRQVSRTASPLPDHDLASSTGTDTSKSNPAPRSVSNLLKPTVAAAARAAANATALASKEKDKKETKDARKPQPTTFASRPAPRVASNPRPGLTAPTAASRARAEAALPPVKRQRVKLKAPMESFRPGRGRANPSKAAILGQAPPARGRRQVVKREAVETFPLPGPLLGSSQAEAAAEEPAPQQDTAPKGGEVDKAPSAESAEKMDKTPSAQPTPAPTSSLAIPRPQPDPEADADIIRTPTALSPLSHSLALSPASSRQTDRSFDSSRSGSSPRKMRLAPSRPLDPVLTPMNSTHSAPSPAATSTPSTGDTPATAHARRISGIPASVKRAMSASGSGSASPRSPVPAVSEETESEDLFATSTPSREKRHGDEATNVVRHDVSTPPAKSAASLLAKLSSLQIDERKVLSPRDANRDKRDEA